MNRKLGSAAAFVLAATFIIGPWIQLVDGEHAPFGISAYDIADFLSGPVWAASLVTLVFTLRESFGERAPKRMTLTLIIAFIAAAAMVAVSSIRSANRHYYLMHPELALESSRDVMVVWTTLVAGVLASGWHFLGWTWLLLAFSGWTTRILPWLLNLLLLVAGFAGLFVYMDSNLEGLATLVSVFVSVWIGILLWVKRTSRGKRARNSRSR